MLIINDVKISYIFKNMYFRLLVASREFIEELNAIKADNISGSEEILRKTLEIVQNELKRQKERYTKLETIIDLMTKVVKAKPEMAVINNTVVYLIDFFQRGVPIEELTIRVKEKVDVMHQKMVQNLVNYLKRSTVVLTFSRSSSIYSGLKRLAEEEEKLPKLIIFEGRPMLEGKKLALEAAELGYKVKYFVDAAMTLAIRKFNPDFIIVGADTIFSNGSVANKIGSYSLAIIAKEFGIPFYVVSTTLKLLLGAKEFKIQNYPTSEVWPEKINENIQVFNPYFEVIPNSYISGYITEHGFTSSIPDVKYKIESEYIKKMYEG